MQVSLNEAVIRMSSTQMISGLASVLQSLVSNLSYLGTKVTVIQIFFSIHWSQIWRVRFERIFKVCFPILLRETTVVISYAKR